MLEFSPRRLPPTPANARPPTDALSRRIHARLQLSAKISQTLHTPAIAWTIERPDGGFVTDTATTVSGSSRHGNHRLKRACRFAIYASGGVKPSGRSGHGSGRAGLARARP